MRAWVVGLVLAVSAVALVAVGLIAWYASSDTTALLDLEPGDCFDVPDASGDAGDDEVAVVETVEVIPCDDPHGAEVVAVGELNPDGELDYPPDAELFDMIEPRCRAIEDVPRDRFGVVPIAPTERSWSVFDGRYLCIAIPFGGGPVTGSITSAIRGA